MATCETNGHLWGHDGKCVMCKEPKPTTAPVDISVEAVERECEAWGVCRGDFQTINKTVAMLRELRSALTACEKQRDLWRAEWEQISETARVLDLSVKELGICEFTLRPGATDNLVFIKHASGESGNFSKAVLALWLAKFWAEEF